MRAAGGRGFTLLEVLVVIGIVAIVVGLLLPVFSKAKAAERAIECVSHLRGIAQGFHSFEQANGRRLPDPAETGAPWEQLLAEHVSPQAFRCPADFDVYPMIWSSYDWRDTGVEETTLAGRRIGELRRSGIAVAYDALPSWHAKRRINVAYWDGSVTSVDQGEFFAELERPVTGP